MKSISSRAYSASNATSPLASTTIPRREPTDRDVQIEILFCGVCHSDLHAARDEWADIMPSVYPIVPGHEIVGRVTRVATAATRYKPGDLVAVGCLVDSDGTCPNCKAGLENYCPKPTLTYNSPDKYGTAPVTYGGYSESIVVDEHFVLRVPPNLDLAGTAPLLCAGITTSPGKAEDAIRLGAHEVVVSTNPEEMAKHTGTFDYILDTVSADHDINSYTNLICLDGNMTLVGVPPKPLALSSFALLIGRRSVSGSTIGGMAETQEMLDFCGEHNITADVEVIPIQKINEAYERLKKSDVKYRFSIDMASLKSE
jgi:uncharacterized zinc-type alcohol dehydrogenase-like protein